MTHAKYVMYATYVSQVSLPCVAGRVRRHRWRSDRPLRVHGAGGDGRAHDCVMDISSDRWGGGSHEQLVPQTSSG